MTRGLFGGMTDYSHQSLEDMIEDLSEEAREVKNLVDRVEAKIFCLKQTDYWNVAVPADFRQIVSYALRHYNTAGTEMTNVALELNSSIQDHHCKRLQRIAEVASEINVNIGKVWHQEYDRKDYANPDFGIVEDIYSLVRDQAVNLLDISNISARLGDFVGRSVPVKTNNPWKSGSFYLFAPILLVSFLAALSQFIIWFIFPLILVATALLYILIAAFQLRNDDRLKEQHFVTLISEVLKRLPLLRSLGN